MRKSFFKYWPLVFGIFWWILALLLKSDKIEVFLRTNSMLVWTITSILGFLNLFWFYNIRLESNEMVIESKYKFRPFLRLVISYIVMYIIILFTLHFISKLYTDGKEVFVVRNYFVFFLLTEVPILVMCWTNILSDIKDAIDQNGVLNDKIELEKLKMQFIVLIVFSVLFPTIYAINKLMGSGEEMKDNVASLFIIMILPIAIYIVYLYNRIRLLFYIKEKIKEEKMDIKIVISDVDKTLVKDYKSEFSQPLIDSLIKLQRQNSIFCLCSGRPTFSLIKLAKNLNEQHGTIINYVSGYNGAEIYGMESGTFLYQDQLTPELVKQVNDKIVSLGEDFLNYQGNELRTNNVENEYGQIEQLICQTPLQQLEEIKPSPKVLGLINPEHMDDVIKEMNQTFPALNITKSTPYFLEVTNPGIDKAHTLDTLADKYNVDISQTLAFGDNLNDYQMLKLAGCGVAVDNALEEVKAISDEVTNSVEENGVSNFINKYVIKG